MPEAAIATVISQVIAAVMCLIYSVRKIPQFQEAFQHLKPDFTVMRQIIRIGVPSGFQYSLLYISSLFLQAIVNGFGETAVGAYTTTQIEMLAVQIPNAIATAMLTYVGQNIGAGKSERIGKGLKVALLMCAVSSLVMIAIIGIFDKYIMRIFVSSSDIISMAATGMLIESFFLIAYSGTRVTLYTLNGAGDSSFSVINGIIEITARILFGFTLTAIPFIGVWGIWLTTGFTWIVTSATALLRYKSGVWKKKGIV